MKKVCSISLTIGLLIGILISCKTETKEEVIQRAEAQYLMDNLRKSAEKGYMFGQHDATLYGIGWKGDRNRSDVRSVCGDYPAVVSFDLGRIEKGSLQNLDGVLFKDIRKEIIRHYERGGLVSISWHVDNPLTGGDSWDVTNDKVVESVLPGGENHEKFQSWLLLVANFLNSLQTTDNEKIPVLFRPWHEHTGSWFWWGQDLCSSEQYKSLWLMTEETLREAGVNNILYVYSPGGDAENYMERYPGDDYVDILGFDTYQYNNEAGTAAFKEAFQRNLAFMDQYCKDNNKLYAITEAGYEKIPNPTWWTDVLQDAIGDYKPIYVLVWRNAYELGENHFFAPYPGHTSEDDFITFYQNPRTLFLNDLDNLYIKTTL